MRILSYRFNSEGELRRKLRSKQFDKETIDLTIARLHKEKWLDDARFAGAFVRTKAARGVGSLRIKRELAAAGVEGETASRALVEGGDSDVERARLVTLCTRKVAALTRRRGDEYVRTREGKANIASSLVRSGFATDLVFEVIREVLKG